MDPLTPFPLKAESTASFVLWAKINVKKNIIERCPFLPSHNFNLLMSFIIKNLSCTYSICRVVI